MKTKTSSDKVMSYKPLSRAPRPKDRDLETPVPKDVKEPRLETALSLYLRQNKVSMAAFSRAIGISQKSILTWMRGEDSPSLAAAYEIERITKGVIPMETWMAIPTNKSRLAEIRNKQPIGLQRIPPPAPGGYAAPANVDGKDDVPVDVDLEGRKIQRNIHRLDDMEKVLNENKKMKLGDDGDE